MDSVGAMRLPVAASGLRLVFAWWLVSGGARECLGLASALNGQQQGVESRKGSGGPGVHLNVAEQWCAMVMPFFGASWACGGCGMVLIEQTSGGSIMAVVASSSLINTYI